MLSCSCNNLTTYTNVQPPSIIFLVLFIIIEAPLQFSNTMYWFLNYCRIMQSSFCLSILSIFLSVSSIPLFFVFRFLCTFFFLVLFCWELLFLFPFGLSNFKFLFLLLSFLLVFSFFLIILLSYIRFLCLNSFFLSYLLFSFFLSFFLFYFFWQFFFLS